MLFRHGNPSGRARLGSPTMPGPPSWATREEIAWPPEWHCRNVHI